MTVFNLPDLGEGLPDAEIRRWYVCVGDEIKTEQPIVSVETAKSIVDVLAPHDGKVVKLYGQSGDIIKTDTALIDIAGQNSAENNRDQEAVVGNLQASAYLVEESATGIQPTVDFSDTPRTVKATPAVRALAKKMQIDLHHCRGTGPAGQILVSDLENKIKPPLKTTDSPYALPFIEGYEPLRGVRRAMAVAMSKSHQTVVPVTLVDDADIHVWPEKTDITLRLIRAIMVACQREPRLNAWFDEATLSLRQHQRIDLGIAMDVPEGLFVPVLKNVAQCNAADLRHTIDRFKIEVKNRSILPEELSGATFILSNVGIFAGRYANPIIIPPMVAILAVGRMMEAVVAYQGQAVIHQLLPLSLTVDHRFITGGEAARFLSALIRDLETP